MGVYIPAKIWKGQVPFVTKDEWALKAIEEFNTAVKKKIWIPRGNEADYVEFEFKDKHHSSPIGKQGGKQKVDYDRRIQTMHHEMGHALSLGHENFHTGWPLRTKLMGLKSIHAEAYKMNAAKYTGYGVFDKESIMLYPNERFDLAGDDPLFKYGAKDVNKELSAADIKLIQLCHPDVPNIA